MILRDLGKKPINVESPAGEDVSYGDDYIALVDEIKKLSSPTSDTTTDWNKVNTLCVKILDEESKNILVACFLSVAQTKINGIAGCSDGVHIVKELLENYWDSLFPSKKRKKGRINALNWWNDQLLKLTSNVESVEWDSSSRQELMADLQFLDSFIADNLPDGPILRSLSENLSATVLEKHDEQVVVAAPVESQKVSEALPVQVEKVKQADIVIVPEPVGGQSASEYFSSGLDYLGHAATEFFSEDKQNPVSYQLNRMAAWVQVDSLPPNQGGETMLPPPAEQLVALLNEQYSSGKWPALLESSEGNIRQYLFWLDLNFWVATSLKQLGFGLAAKSVLNETQSYVERLQGIDKLSFQGGLPFADVATKKWLVGTKSTTGDVSSLPVGDDYQTIFFKLQNEAVQLVQAKGLSQAITFLNEKCPVIKGAKGSFFRDQALCKIMMQANKHDLALPFANRLLEQIAFFNLDQWEPELALSSMFTAYDCLSEINNEDSAKQCLLLKDRIILLAPESAVNIV